MESISFRDVRKFNRPSDLLNPMASEYSPFIAPLLVLWLYLPGYLSNTTAMLGGKWIPEMTGMVVKPIDGGRVHGDGNRLLGDGKTWNGLVGGTLGGGLLGMLTHALSSGSEDSDAPFIDPMTGVTSDAWFWIGGEWGAVFVLGCVLGFGCMVGDSAGSFVKRRLGHKREGDESSEAPLLDTLPFAVSTFLFGQLLLDPSIVGSSDLVMGMAILLLITPVIHRAFNLLGYSLGLKSVPY